MNLLISLYHIRNYSKFNSIFIACRSIIGYERQKLFYAIERIFILLAGYFHNLQFKLQNNLFCHIRCEFQQNE